MGRFLATCALLATTLLAVACAPAQHAAAIDGPGEPGTAQEEWPFMPVQVRLSPLSRGVRGGEGCRLEALVECLDRFGGQTRAVGMLWVEAGQGEQAQAVEADLTSMDTNASVWDPVLRVYRLRVQLPAETCPANARLPVEVRLRLPAGGILQAKAEVACP